MVRFKKPNQTGKENRLAIYLDNLGLFVGLRLFLFVVTNSVKSIRYLYINRFGRMMVALLKQFRLCLDVKKIQLDFSSGGLWYLVQAAVEDVSKVITKKLVENGSFMDHISEKIEHTRRIAFLRRSVGIDLYRPMVLSFLAQREAFSGTGKVCKVVIVNISDLLPLFIEASRRWTNQIKFVNMPNLKNSFGVRLGRFLVEQGRLLGWAVLDSFKRKAQQNDNKAGTVAIQYASGLDRDARLNDLWWYDGMSGMENSRCLIFFSHPRRPATDQIIQSIKNSGYPFRILNKAVNRTSNYSTDRFSVMRFGGVISKCISLVKMLLWSRFAEAPFWQLKKWVVVFNRTRQWQTFMEAENVKVVFDVAETSPDMASLAADIVGAIKLGMHWGNYAVPYARLTPIHQVQFIWGPRFQSIMEAMGADSNVFVQAGCIFDNSELRPKWRQRAALLRTNLEKAGVRYIVGVLDKSCGLESLSPPPYHVDFYEKLLSWAENDPELGLIIKPKNDDGPGVLSYKPELTNYIQRLMSTKRVIMLGGRIHVAEAALASDLVVALGLSSGGVLSALEGVPTIFWDTSFGDKGPLNHWVHSFDWDNKNFVFGTMDDLIAAAKKYLNGTSAMPGLGDLSHVLDEIDSFRDGKAKIRVGSFVRWFLEGLDQGLSRDEALRLSIRNYQSEWGADKVYSRL